ncbi:carbohydrate ABC transporter permease [Marinilactibacillus piezotolerans]|uniref:carbohydrate ABC transporter permease n=1 Tax=Marinilactibacillus piezotolerans TaxID=258723 RepID=UPI0009B04270|nr:sugar ABC transporter permease [Marinilactibacillus piezotolerans]
MMEKPTLKSSLKSLFYIAPMLLIVGTFNLYPIVQSFLMSLYQDYNIFTGEVGGYGFSNFVEILQDPKFILAIRNTFIFVLGVVPISIVISLTIAVLLTKIEALSSFFRSIYFLPFVTSTVAISIVWSWIYHSRFGLLNYGLGLLGVAPIEFLEDPDYAMLALVIMAVWKGLGFNIILFLVGLNNIDANYYSAAKIDGAKGFQRFTNITVPLLGPTIFLVSVMGVINSFKVFDEVFALFQSRPGPAGSAMTVVYYIFQKFYQENQYAVAAAAGIVLFLIILVVTLIQMGFNKKFVHY